MLKVNPVITLVFTFAIIALWGALSGCKTSAGPWGKQAYERPSAETPVHEVVVSPGSPLPFEQQLPTGNMRLDYGVQPNARPHNE